MRKSRPRPGPTPQCGHTLVPPHQEAASDPPRQAQTWGASLDKARAPLHAPLHPGTIPWRWMVLAPKGRAAPLLGLQRGKELGVQAEQSRAFGSPLPFSLSLLFLLLPLRLHSS